METELLGTISCTETIQHLTVGDGDLLVFTTPNIIGYSRITNLVDQLREIFPKAKVLVLQEGLRLEQVLRIESSE